MAMQVDTKTLKSKANELKSLNSRLRMQMLSLRTSEMTLNMMWDGDANDAFHKAFAKDIEQMEKFAKAIDKYVDALNQVASKYESTEFRNVVKGVIRTYK